MMKQQFGGAFIANKGFTADTAREAITNATANAIAFGKAAIANPDLVDRIRNNAPWNEPKPESFYGDGQAGYLDYPRLGS